MTNSNSTLSQHRYEDLIAIFNNCFQDSHNTCLVKGGDEPIYLPADDLHSHHEIRFAHGFYASALHECAHWLIAGEERRKLVDFGYWYEPDGRTAQQQQAFEKVEVKPQALEWILAVAAGFKFRVSVDNLSGEATDSAPFKQAVHQQVLDYLKQGIPKRANTLRLALSDFYGTTIDLQPNHFPLESL